MQIEDLKSKLIAELAHEGFDPVPLNPLDNLQGSVRPAVDIVRRAVAIECVLDWVCAPSQILTDSMIQGFIQNHDLESAFTADEWSILESDRDEAQDEHFGSVGWQLENLWSLLWVLGMPYPPSLTVGQSSDDQVDQFHDFLKGPFLIMGKKQFDPNTYTTRPYLEVAEMEYRFYLAHNCARNAQLGRDTCPEWFDPIINGGCIHERRHALTWCLSTCQWDETDLST